MLIEAGHNADDQASEECIVILVPDPSDQGAALSGFLVDEGRPMFCYAGRAKGE
jgi:hypothetical protein